MHCTGIATSTSFAERRTVTKQSNYKFIINFAYAFISCIDLHASTLEQVLVSRALIQKFLDLQIKYCSLLAKFKRELHNRGSHVEEHFVVVFMRLRPGLKKLLSSTQTQFDVAFDKFQEETSWFNVCHLKSVCQILPIDSR